MLRLTSCWASTISWILLLNVLKDCSWLLVSRFGATIGAPPAPTCIPEAPCTPDLYHPYHLFLLLDLYLPYHPYHLLHLFNIGRDSPMVHIRAYCREEKINREFRTSPKHEIIGWVPCNRWSCVVIVLCKLGEVMLPLSLVVRGQFSNHLK